MRRAEELRNGTDRKRLSVLRQMLFFEYTDEFCHGFLVHRKKKLLVNFSINYKDTASRHRETEIVFSCKIYSDSLFC